MQAELIYFNNYTAPQIRKILEDRARTGLGRSSNERNWRIAALTVKNTNSDVRVAIKTLYYCALKTGSSIHENFDRARRDILTDIMNDLNDKNLMILRAITLDQEKFVKSAFEKYKQLSLKMKEEPFSYVHYYANLSFLQSLGLILLASTKVRRTYTNRIHLNVDYEVLERVWKSRFE